MRPDVSHLGLAVDTGDGGSCRRPPLGGRTRLVIIIIAISDCGSELYLYADDAKVFKHIKMNLIHR